MATKSEIKLVFYSRQLKYFNKVKTNRPISINDLQNLHFRFSTRPHRHFPSGCFDSITQTQRNRFHAISLLITDCLRQTGYEVRTSDCVSSWKGKVSLKTGYPKASGDNAMTGIYSCQWMVVDGSNRGA